MDLKQLFLVVRRRWISLASVVALALLVSAAISFSMTPEYGAQARVFISVESSNPAEALAGSTFSASRVESYASLTNSHGLLQRMVHALGTRMTPRGLGREISASVEQDTTIIDLTAQDPSPTRARRIADVAATELARYVGELDKPVGGGGRPIKATVVDSASVDPNPVSPRLWLNLTVAGLLGLLLGLALALVRDALDDTVKRPDDPDSGLALPVLGDLQDDPDVRRRPLLTDVPSASPRAEAFRVIRSKLQFLHPGSPARAIVVTSPGADEGKTWTALNLAISMAQSGQRVLLVDGNLRDPKLAGILGLRRAVGLANLLVDHATLEECIQHHEQSGVDLLAGGQAGPNAAELIQSEAVEKLLVHVASMYDRVVVDAPAVLPVADAAVLARHVDGAVLVVRHGRTTRGEVAACEDALQSVGGRLLGVVVNRTPRRAAPAYAHRAAATAT